FGRGRVASRLRQFPQAALDFTAFLERRPQAPEGYLERARALEGLNDCGKALADLDRALALGASETLALFPRSRLKKKLGDAEGSLRDLEAALRARPQDDTGWIMRAIARLPGDPRAALADLDEALKLNPVSEFALQNKAHVLSEVLG